MPTNKYKKGVSMAAINTLNVILERVSPQKRFQGSTLKAHSKKMTVAESIIWEEKVEKLFLSHKCLPSVNFFQK